MSAAPSLLPVAAAVLLAGLMAGAADEASAQASGWLDSDRGAYSLSIQGNNGNHNGWDKKDKKKDRSNDPVVLPEPPMLVLLGTALLAVGFVAWRKHRKL